MGGVMSRGFRGGRGGGFRGGRGGGFKNYNQGPPDTVQELGGFLHPCKDEAVVKLTSNDIIPSFNAPIYLENKQKIGKIEEVFGPINEVYCSIKFDDGFVASSYKPGDKFYAAPFSLHPAEKFTQPPKPKTPTGDKMGKRGGGRGGGRGGRGGRGGGGGFGRGGGGGRGGGFGRGGGGGRGGGFGGFGRGGRF